MADILNINREQEALRSFDRLNNRRLNGKFDFTIIVGGEKIYADHNVLASGSDYFDAMLSHDTLERQTGQVEMKGVDFGAVEICVDHIYRREISVQMEKYRDVMVAASMMQLPVLSNAIEERLSNELSAKTFFTIQNVAKMFGKQELITKCEKFAVGNFESLAKEEQFMTLGKSFVVELLTSVINEVDEEKKLKVILEWVRFEESRKEDFLELLKFIDYSKIHPNIGQSYIKNEPLINRNNECLVFFSLAVMESISSTNKLRKDLLISAKKILIFGKSSGNYNLYDPNEGTFNNLSLDQLNIKHYSVAFLDGYIYVLGEDQSFHRLKYWESGESWQDMASLNVPHGPCPSVTVLGGHIYVIGGHIGYSSNAVERYNRKANKWAMLQKRSESICNAEILASGGYIYSFGGLINSHCTNAVARLDVITSGWENLSPMSEVKAAVAAAECGDFIYVAGGNDISSEQGRLKTLERYDPSSDQWTILCQMNIEHSWFNLHHVGKFLYAVGGFNSSPHTIEKYDIENDTWEMLDVPFDIAYSIVI